MAVNKQKKGEILKDLKELFGRIKTATFVNFHGLSVKDTSALRRGLREDNVRLFVAKKTLIKKALGEAAIPGDIPMLDGEIAIAYPHTEDADITASARGVYAFQKKFDGRLSIVGGIFERMFRGKEGMLEIATIPSMKTLRGMFVNVINSPIQGLVVALSAIAEAKESK
ncbi:MAG: 50S ribosomal protein L10 [Patescibacteria group bacterium]